MKRVFKIFGVLSLGFVLCGHSCVQVAGLDESRYQLSSCNEITEIPNFAEDKSWIFTQDVNPRGSCDGFKTFMFIKKDTKFFSDPTDHSFLISFDKKKCELVFRSRAYCGLNTDLNFHPGCLSSAGNHYEKWHLIIANLISEGEQKNITFSKSSHQRIGKEALKESCRVL